ncbi:histidine phosphatase family protein [Trueperella pyogenes]|uniref:histidine phosphatase family protein n=2 Tax=Trueperella pyogenes TaxID=1661 RepID=UPI00057F083F|nr:histidine phosphatase family protein [Trueperella pyogenes]WHU57871.1 histidine phosphatase family protein [Trueperella pyogenes]
MTTHIYMIRHGRQSDKRCNVDVDLSLEGREQARLVGERIATWDIGAIYTSSMVRARETAEIISDSLGVDVNVRSELREISFGEMEGLTDEEIVANFAQFQRDQSKMELDLQYPGGENISQVLQRSIGVFDEIARSSPSRVAVVSHGGIIRAMVTHATSAPPARWRNIARNLENTSITELVAETNSYGVQYRLERLNDYAHLEPHPHLLRSAWAVAEN